MNHIHIRLWEAAFEHRDAEVISLLSLLDSPEEFKNRKSETSLLRAAGRGSTETLLSLLSDGANINAKESRSGFTALMRAAFRGHTATVLALLRVAPPYHAKKEVKNSMGGTALVLASMRGHISTAAALIGAGAVVKAKDDGRMTSMIWATFFGHTEIVRLLLENGALRGHKDNSGRTAMDWAREKHHVDIMDIFFPDTSARRAAEERAAAAAVGAAAAAALEEQVRRDVWLWHATANGRLEECKQWLQRGANPNGHVNAHGDTCLTKASLAGHMQIVQLLLDSGAHPEAADRNGKTALIKAAHTASLPHTKTIERLLEAGASTDVQERKHGRTALMLASHRGNTDAVSRLLDFGAATEATGKCGGTALIAASRSGRVEAIELLLKAGADEEARDRNGKTAHCSATHGEHVHVAAILSPPSSPPPRRPRSPSPPRQRSRSSPTSRQRSSSPPRPLPPPPPPTPSPTYAGSATDRIRADFIDVGVTPSRLAVEAVAPSGAYAITPHGGGGAPSSIASENSEMLWQAAWDGDAAEVGRLLAGPNGATPDERRGSNCETALLMASRLGNVSVVRLLLAAGADPEIKANDGNTALIWASYKGQLSVVKLLLRHGVDWSATDKSGKTALAWAQRWDHVEITEALVAVENEAEAQAHAQAQAHQAQAQVTHQKDFAARIQDCDEAQEDEMKLVAAAEV